MRDAASVTMLLCSNSCVLQIDTLQFLALRRKLSSRQVSNAEEGSRLGLDDACKKLAVQLPQPDRAMDTIAALLQVRDNNAFSVMQAALAPGASQEVSRAWELRFSGRPWILSAQLMLEPGAAVWMRMLGGAILRRFAEG